MKRYPAGIPAHHLYNHHTVMTTRRRMQLIYRLGSRSYRRIESESNVGPEQIVVNRLRHTHNDDALFRKRRRRCHRTVTADTYQCIDTMILQSLNTVIGKILRLHLTADLHWILKRIRNIAASQDGSANGQNIAHIVIAEHMHTILDKTEIPVLDTPYLKAVLRYSRLRYRTDNRIKPRTITAACHYRNRPDILTAHICSF